MLDNIFVEIDDECCITSEVWHVAILPREKPSKETLPKTRLRNLSENDQSRVEG